MEKEKTEENLNNNMDSTPKEDGNTQEALKNEEKNLEEKSP